MSTDATFDPRPALQPSAERSALPTVQRPRAGPSNLTIGVGFVIAALLLFVVLEGRRQSVSAPAVAVRGPDRTISAAPPPLFVPPLPTTQAPVRILPALPPQASRELARVPPPVASPPPDVVYVSQPAPEPPMPEPAPRAAAGPALVFDAGGSRSDDRADGGERSTAADSAEREVTNSRARAGTLVNHSTTVPQGTLIPAVLETAFDSTRPGLARALVQRDIYGFDGSRILIPRGSRLIGEYRADAARGQKRAMVIWSRLIRPDGATITIASPAADPVGRGGIRAKVNSHFFERFGGAILQSVLDVGVNLASRSSNSPVIVALPGSLQGATRATTDATQIPPTLSVRQGTSISVFVARDLDFTDVERTE